MDAFLCLSRKLTNFVKRFPVGKRNGGLMGPVHLPGALKDNVLTDQTTE